MDSPSRSSAGSVRTRRRRFAVAALGAAAVAIATSTPAQAVERSGTVTSGPGKAVAQAPQGNHLPPQRPQGARPTMSDAEYAAAKAAADRAPQGNKPGVLPQATSGPLAASSGQAAFHGTSQTSGLRPPDTHGAVGLTQFAEVTNSFLQVFSKTNGASLFSASLNSFFNRTAAGQTTIFDPRMVYDKTWNRWIIFAESFAEADGDQFVHLAVSNSSNAAGGYCQYTFQAPRPLTSDFYDYPQLGMDQDALYVTANIFAASYKQSNIFSIPKAQVYNCRGFGSPVFTATTGTLAPSIVEDDNNSMYVMNSRPGNAFVSLYRYNNGGRQNQSFVLQSNVPVPSYAVPPAGRQVTPAGALDANRLDSLDSRFQDHGTQIGDSVLNAHTIALGSFPAGKYYVVDAEGAGANTVPAGRSGFIYESGTSDDFQVAVAGSAVGGVSGNPIGRIYATWTATDALHGTTASRHNARVRVAGKFVTDTPVMVGASGGTSTVAYNPTGDTVERWGDYASMSLDPVDPGGCPAGNRAWFVGEWNGSSATSWASRFGRTGYC